MAEQIVFTVIGPILGLLGLFVTVRNWFYGGSVVRVEIELGRQDVWHAIVTGSVDRWANGDATALEQVQTQAVDVVRLVVRNLGRTPATIVDVGLVAGRPPVPGGRFMLRPARLIEGEALPTRIEAHDAKTYLFYAVPLIRNARDHIPGGTVAFRGAVTTGTGKIRLSRRWSRGKWNVWRVRGPGDQSITGVPLTTAEFARLWWEQVANMFPQPMLLMKPFIDIAARRADEGAARESIHAELQKIAAIHTFPDAHLGSVDTLLYSLADQLVSRREQADSADPPAVPVS